MRYALAAVLGVVAVLGGAGYWAANDAGQMDALPAQALGPVVIGRLYEATASPDVDLAQPEPAAAAALRIVGQDPVTKALVSTPADTDGTVTVAENSPLVIRESTPNPPNGRRWAVYVAGTTDLVDPAILTWVPASNAADPLFGGAVDTVTLRISEVGEYTLIVTVNPNTPGFVDHTLNINVVEKQNPPSATLELAAGPGTLGAGLLPLNDWAPLGAITLSATEADGNVAVRGLGRLDYCIDGLGDREEVLEFGLYDANLGAIRWTWDNTGFPYGTVSGVCYSMDFYTNGYLNDMNLNLWPSVTDLDVPGTYYLVFRTSAVFTSGRALSAVFNFLTMYAPTVEPGDKDGFGRPRDVEDFGIFIDEYPVEDPDDIPWGILGNTYRTAFSVIDATGATSVADARSIPGIAPQYLNHRFQENLWAYPKHLYTPTAAHVRPRWDGVTQAFDMALGEWLELRNLFSIEDFVPMLGINIHQGAGLAGDSGDPPHIREINIIMTDIGANPAGPRGNGGFDPNLALDGFTARYGDLTNSPGAVKGRHFAFNGVWLWHDGNNNGLFDEPIKSNNNGIAYDGDRPMIPDPSPSYPVLNDAYEPKWEYIPYPPWGGDPAWKIRLRFGAYRDTYPGEPLIGNIEPVPDVWTTPAPSANEDEMMDYWVVVRADSGYNDVSLMTGDGIGMGPGTDFRIFVEPRRWNPELRVFENGIFARQGGWDGGIITSHQMVAPGGILGPMEVNNPWQNDPRWDYPNPGEPWWPERTLNWTNAKPQRTTLDVHDLVLTFETDRRGVPVITDIGYWTGGWDLGRGSVRTVFSRWLDPFEIVSGAFYYGHTVGTQYAYAVAQINAQNVAVISEDELDAKQVPYETAPFRNPATEPRPGEERAPGVYPYNAMRPLPTLPRYATWPPALLPANALPPGRYPHISDWPKTQRAARLLTQKVDINSKPTAMLGFNLVGVDDPVTNRVIGGINLTEITVAFWGPNFHPTDLMPLDPNGLSRASGVLLYEDSSGSGMFEDGFLGVDTPVALKELRWRNAPEPVDLDGDFIADDLDGDGVVTAADYAWVLTLVPRQPWRIPESDFRSGNPNITLLAKSAPANDEFGFGDSETYVTQHQIKINITVDENGNAVGQPVPMEKALAPGGHVGDDLFLVVTTSDKISAFESFRAFVPWSLPGRPAPDQNRRAGVVLDAGSMDYLRLPPEALVKINPEENPVQDFYSHDMLEANVPATIVDLTANLSAGERVISPDDGPRALLGIDVTTNRPQSVLLKGAAGTGGNASFNVAGAAWAVNQYRGKWLIDSLYHGYEIIGNTANTLQLRYGQPASGGFRIVQDPTFLEQVIVEFYGVVDGGGIGDDNEFNPDRNLLPMNHENPAAGTVSGLSLYRDNEFHPDNRPGVFDPGIDIPVVLNEPPYKVGATGEPKHQYMMVFSSPGTDNWPVAESSQPSLRQWVPDTWGGTTNVAGGSPDFFAVVRLARNVEDGDDFRMGIVSWGPDTPTAPDPDTFAVSQRSRQNPNLYDLFTEFPWGSRALGFITFYETHPLYHYLDGMTARQERDATGIPWVRSTSNVQQRTGVMTTSAVPRDLEIFSVNRNFLPEVIPPGGLRLIITGISFGENPVVTVGGVTLTIVTSSDTYIEAIIPAGTTFPAGTTVDLVVTNPVSTQSDTWPLEVFAAGQLLIDAATPNVIPAVAPPEGTAIILTGIGFGNQPEVTFDGYPVIVNAANDIEISLTIPGGTRLTEPVDVEVFNPVTGQSDFRDDLFTLFRVVIESASTGVLPQNVPPSGLRLFLYGRGFGTQPEVTFNGLPVTVVSSTDTAIDILIPGNRFFPVGQPVNVRVVNPISGGEDERDDLFVVIGAGTDAPAGNIEFTDLIRNEEALVPLIDWVPLVRIVMSHGEEDAVYRALKSLSLLIKPDPRDEAAYGRVPAIEYTDLLEFGVFIETGDELVGQLDAEHDRLVTYSAGQFGGRVPLTWDSTGAPVGQLIDYQPGRLLYDLNFLGNGTPGNPQFPLTSAPGDGNSYIIAFRTSATWRSMLTLSFEVLGAEIVDAAGNFPRNEDGDVIDGYTPDFYADEPETLDPETAYSSSFAVWDITGSPRDAFQPAHANAWNWSRHLYTPVAEHSRPRWDSTTPMMDFVTGEWLDLRRLFSLEEFVPLIGINLHSTLSVNVPDVLRSAWHPYTGENPSPAQPELMEVNVVLTDIGADPAKQPGNGGFDPREGLHRFTNETWPPSGFIDPENAYAPDFSFNGLWVWHDTNGDGVFNPPTKNAGGGLTYNGDYPMFPRLLYSLDSEIGINLNQWESIMYPPGGGDPWWKIKLQFQQGRRRFITEGDASGYVTAVPNNVLSVDPPIPTASDYSADFFVVMHTDSGFRNASLGIPDGEGLQLGADTRAFIEPRRFNPLTGNYDGGIYVSSMIPGPGDPVLSDFGLGSAWQNDVRWGSEEPWWNQRTLNVNNAKPVRGAVEVHDLVMTYTSSSLFAPQNNLDIGLGGGDAVCFGFSAYYASPTWFDMWLDPFGLLQNQFLNRHSVESFSWTTWGLVSYSFTTESGVTYQINTQYDDWFDPGQYAFETVPFFIPFVDGLTYGPRSYAYPNPPAQPRLPVYATWPAALAPGEYPRFSDWAPQDRKARLLKQRVDVLSDHTAMLGINLAGVNDPVTNEANSMRLNELTVAFWGPDFHPRHLMPLDPNGANITSGVLLWEDIDGDGVFYGRPFGSLGRVNDPVLGYDQIVPLQNLRWSNRPELVDLNGDGLPDDMNGDGIVDSRDEAWVLTIRPQQIWPIPYIDGSGTTTFSGEDRLGCYPSLLFFDKSGRGADMPLAGGGLLAPLPGGQPVTKSLDPAQPQIGDDLFISVRTSDEAPALSSFRAVIPATLPERAESLRQAGIRIFPQGQVHPGALAKHDPEEGAVQGFFGHDMLEMNVGVKIIDLTAPSQQVFANSGEFAILGVDVSTNRPETLVASGSNGLAGPGIFTVASAGWQRDAFVRYWLIDRANKAFRITANGPQHLELEHGREPQSGAWKIVRDATFLEQLVVEFYGEVADSRFNVLTDLLPLSRDPRVSGVALYRDNDGHPENRNGVYDPGIDVPVELNEAPRYFGVSGGADARVRFIFSSPGTDDLPVARAEQPNLRQWVPLTWGASGTSPDTGPEFFVVVRPSGDLEEGDIFSAGIVSWGPATPSEPDPENFLGQKVSPVEVKLFREFPFADRGLGFITYHAQSPQYYLLEGFKARQYTDTSGYDWIRTSTSKHRRTQALTATRVITGPDTITIDSASIDELPATILPGQTVSVIFYGKNFGTTPTVDVGGYEATVRSASNTQIECVLTNRADMVPEEPVTVIVRNPRTQQQGTRSDLFRITGTSNQGNLRILSCRPGEGTREDFPVAVRGAGFEEGMEIYFGQTRMPIRQINPAGTEAIVDFPVGGLPQTGWLDVTVRVMAWDQRTILDQSIRPRAFKYINQPSGVGCGSSGGAGGGMGGGDMLLLAGLGLAMGAFGLRRKHSARHDA